MLAWTVQNSTKMSQFPSEPAGHFCSFSFT